MFCVSSPAFSCENLIRVVSENTKKAFKVESNNGCWMKNKRGSREIFLIIYHSCPFGIFDIFIFASRASRKCWLEEIITSKKGHGELIG